MPTVYDLQTADDPRDVVHRTVEVLANGGVAVLPTEAEYVVAAALDSPAAVARLGTFDATGSERGLLLRSREMALDYLPGVESVGRRLLDRCTPGPLVLSLPERLTAGGSLASLDGSVRDALISDGAVVGWIPAHDFLGETLRLLPTPLVFASVVATNGEEATEAPRRAFAAADVLLVDDGPTRYPEPATRVAVDGDVWSVTRPGCVAESTLQRMACRVVVFVCTGNTCRSPMAAGLFRKLLAERLECDPDDLASRGFVVESAGLSAGYGMPASPEGVTLLGRRGIDLNQHASRPLTDETLDVADHVWTLTRGHLDAITTARPDAAARCELLARDGSDVADPFGGDEADYERSLEQIERLLQERLDDPSLLPPR
jgi:protein-tyrosine-phosphatase/tRNA A37 threonylcarbamoyladenosine synthetase subunit TsaC/SUA5/YrdC